ncbi:hypothetical protein [Aquamicrobium sp.]|uniref:hypothetical protein n=1 Tax=Aquamicrobium sp. TaxID=1872579 RepID=UPI0025872CA7|nr:hypothetical protein [Aquamicrobium sp.]MCK9550262.1 hypothetical protein [Aquamicrobium sp.]
MNYESWRISYQSSEQAARAVFNEIAALRADLAASQAECERLRADAERYRWLASDIDGNAQDDLLIWLSGTVVPKESIDAAIDAARAGKGE